MSWDEILDSIESVSEGFPTYSLCLSIFGTGDYLSLEIVLWFCNIFCEKNSNLSDILFIVLVQKVS